VVEVLAPRDIAEYILPTERRVLRVRAHPASMVPDIGQTGLVVLALYLLDTYLPSGLIVDTLTWYVAVVAVFRLLVLTALWWVERIVITDKRVMISTGLLTHRLAMMPLKKVTDLTFHRSLMGRVIGYGTVVVESAGQIQGLDRIDYVSRPEEVYDMLIELIFGEKRQTRSHRLSKPRR
jgi:uncharacterized membrane protein YdbT with pleckstrin-like domain